MKNCKTGFVGLIGFPNSGKSQLANALVGEKVSIVTSKPQTTRQRVQGVYTDEEMQAIYVDAPGIIKSTSGINHFLQQEYESVLEESDVLVAVLNIDENNKERLDSVVELVMASQKPWIAVITKSDLSMFHRTEILKGELQKFNVPVVVTSSLKRPQEAQEFVNEALKDLLPEASQPLYDSEIYTTQSLRDLSKEIIREKCFLYLKHELPYQMAVRMNKYEENEVGVDKAYAEIVIAKKRHQPMVLGVGGQLIKKIGVESRSEIESIIGKKLFLDLHVSVRENWMKNKGLMKEFGYVQPQK